MLFGAVEQVDAGRIYLKDYIELNGDELLEEIKQKQAEKTEELILRLLDLWPDIVSSEQIGESSYYEKRTERDDQLDVGHRPYR